MILYNEHPNNRQSTCNIHRCSHSNLWNQSPSPPSIIGTTNLSCGQCRTQQRPLPRMPCVPSQATIFPTTSTMPVTQVLDLTMQPFRCNHQPPMTLYRRSNLSAPHFGCPTFVRIFLWQNSSWFTPSWPQLSCQERERSLRSIDYH